jgi:hypothetical protein
MADNIFMGSPYPTSTSTIQSQTTVPEFYSNYLQDVANLGTNAITQGGVAGFSPLQQQAFQMAPNAAFSGAQTAGDAASLLGAAGTTATPSMVGAYMNPYVGNVVNEMGRLQQQNIQRNVLPTLKGAGVGTGSFGSSRQANATGQTLADMQANLIGQQYGALNTGYQNAMSQASTDLNRQLQAGQGLGNVATEQYNIGTGGLKTLADLGGLQQQQGQKMLDYPMLQAQNYARLFGTPSIPTGTTRQEVAPATQLTPSPLGQITSLLSGLGSILYPGQQQQTSSSTIAGGGGNNLQSQINTLTNLVNRIAGQSTTAKDGESIFYAKGGGVRSITLPPHIARRLAKRN